MPKEIIILDYSQAILTIVSDYKVLFLHLQKNFQFYINDNSRNAKNPWNLS